MGCGITDTESLKVLLTVQALEGAAGGALYVRDFAEEMLRQGHRPAVYCRRLGAVEHQLTTFGVPVSDSLDRLAVPDVIHGNAPIETVAAMLHFPGVPVVYVCHGWDSPDALAPKIPGILRYLAVSEISRDRLIYFDGIDESRIRLHLNPVDLTRFKRRGALPERPQRALVFSNTLTDSNLLPMVREACEREGLQLDAVGLGVGTASDQPEHILGNYDIVFGRGRCALEAVATGCAVILCDWLGVGELLTTENYEVLRVRNFGRRALRLSSTVDSLVSQIRAYDACDASRLADRVRETEGLGEATYVLTEIFREAIAESRDIPPADASTLCEAAARFLERIAPTSNTFYFSSLVGPYEKRARHAEAKLRRLGETLAAPRLEGEDLPLIRLRDAIAPPITDPGVQFEATVVVENGSRKLLSGFGQTPTNCCYHWLRGDGSTVVFDGLRSEMYPPLPPGGTCRYTVRVDAPAEPGSYILRLTLVQELVAWLEYAGGFCDLPVEVSEAPKYAR